MTRTRFSFSNASLLIPYAYESQNVEKAAFRYANAVDGTSATLKTSAGVQILPLGDSTKFLAIGSAFEESSDEQFGVRDTTYARNPGVPARADPFPGKRRPPADLCPGAAGIGSSVRAFCPVANDVAWALVSRLHFRRGGVGP